MRRFNLALLMVVVIALQSNSIPSMASQPKIGKKCPVLSATQVVGSKSFICVLQNGKKVWIKGSSQKKPKKTRPPAPTPTPTSTPTSAPISIPVPGTKVIPRYTFSNTTYSLSSAAPGSSVVVTFNLSSDDPTVTTPTVTLDGVVSHVEATLVSGDKRSGSWRAIVNIPNSAFAGTYNLMLTALGYANGEKNEEWKKIGQITVSGPIKLVPYYRFSGVTIDKTQVSRGDTVNVSFTFASNDSTVEPPYAAIDGIVNPVIANKTSGTNLSGSWNVALPIPGDAAPGTYNLIIFGMGFANGEKNDDQVTAGSISVQ